MNTLALVAAIGTGVAGLLTGLAGLAKSRSDAKKTNVDAAAALQDMALSLAKHWETRAVLAETRLRELEIKVAVLTEQLHQVKGEMQ